MGSHGEFTSRMAFSAPVSRQNTSHGRYRRTLSAFPGWFFSRSPYRVSNRQSQRRFQSEPPQQFSRGRGSGSLPAAPQNRPIAGQNNAPYENSSNNQNGNGIDHRTQTRRLQSLPARKPKADDGGTRPIKSAPDNGQPLNAHAKANARLHHSPSHQQQPAGVAHRPPPHAFTGQQPPHARSRIADYDSGAELHQKTHGIATRAYEENYLRSHKFATSWARVRAENPTFMEHTPGQMLGEKRTDDSQSPDRTPRYPPNITSPTSNTEDSLIDHRKKATAHYHQPRGRMPVRRRRVKKQKLSGSRSPRSSKPADTQNGDQSVPGDTDESGSDLDRTTNEDSFGSPEVNEADQTGKKRSPRRGPWIDSVVVPVSNKPPPKLDARRCRHDLTFRPEVNTDEIVTKAYTDQDGIAIKDRVYFEDDFMLTDEEDGYASPGNESSTRSNENSPNRTGNERMLSKREARMYIKMMNVYGSDAFKNQRREWFVKKLGEVQEAKSKFEEQEKRNLQKKKEDDRVRQQRQLNYVRNKFRKQQMHRFQTQYVTARVLEYERANRHTYGLPEDFGDLAYLLKDEDEGSENQVDNGGVMPKENKSNVNPIDKKNQKNAKQTGQNKKQAIKSDKQRAQEGRENEARQKEQERLARARQNQSAWYTHADTASSGRQESPTSHGTSGYESEKNPLSEQNENGSPADDVINENHLKHPADQRKKAATHRKTNEGENRLASQKHIYKKTSPNRAQQQRAAMIHENKLNQRQKKDNAGVNRTAASKAAQQSKNKGVATKEEQPGDKIAKSDQKDTPSETNLQEKDDNIKEKKSPEEDENKSKVHVPDSQRDKKENKEGFQHHGSSPAKSTLASKREASLYSTKNESGKPPSSSEAEDSKNKTSKDEKNKPSSLKVEQPSTEKKVVSTEGEPRTTLKSETDQSDNFDKTKNQPINGQLQSNTNQQNNRSHLGKASTQKTGDNSQAAKSNKTMVGDKSDTRKSQPEDNTHITIKRVPLAGTISKDNAPQTFGVKEDKLEHMMADQKQPTLNVRQPSGTQDKPIPKEAIAPKSSATTKENIRRGTTSFNNKPIAAIKVQESSASRDKTKAPSAKSARSDDAKKPKPKKNERMADKMFNIKTGPTWNPHAKVPKMEGIDTVVVTGKDGKGRVIKKKRNVDDVVREASDLLKVAEKDAPRARANSTFRMSRADSPAVTLGSDFDVDDDEEPDDDIFERLRRKYNIQIDSDEEDGNVDAR